MPTDACVFVYDCKGCGERLKPLAPAALSRIRENLKADLAEAIAQGRVAIKDVELAADIVIGVWLQVTRGTLDRRA